jgi:hypothetical protein
MGENHFGHQRSERPVEDRKDTEQEEGQDDAAG